MVGSPEDSDAMPRANNIFASKNTLRPDGTPSDRRQIG
jgi:hypothetical protein